MPQPDSAPGWLERLYLRLSGQSSTEYEPGDSQQRATAKAFVQLLTAQWLTKVGDALVNPKITLPWILSVLGAPAAFTGWLVPLRESGSLLPQLFIAAWVKRVAQRKWLWCLGSVLQALSVAALVLVVLLLEGATAGWAVLLLLAAFSLARGLCSVSSKDVMGKVIAKPQRGSLTGVSASLAGLVTLAVAAALWWLPESTLIYTVGFGLAAALWLLAALVYSRIHEPASEREAEDLAPASVFQPLQAIWQDSLLMRFVIARTLMLCSALSAPFYVVLAQQSDDSGLGLLALLMAASGLASLVSGSVWGRLADRSSRHVLLLASALVAMCGVVVVAVDWKDAELVALPWFIPLMYFLLSIAHEGVRTGRKTYLVNMADGNQRTDYVSASNTWIGLMLLLLGSIGSLSGVISVAGVILLLALLGLAGVAMAWTLPEVEEPEDEDD
ncbi:MFS transporter [Oceanobacter kriegii]|uniref:MFS transporter n=1 Tax=Oceanobacter kriegii TaxID=64972 RepID=UPI000422A3D1|nr:MFS transporter [Oceanobacter kriegii]